MLENYKNVQIKLSVLDININGNLIVQTNAEH